jgi:hypothetical protein
LKLGKWVCGRGGARMRNRRRAYSCAGLGATAAAILALAGVSPVAVGARHATPDLYEVVMLGTYSDVRETITSARDGTGAMHEFVAVRWTARTTAAAPLARAGARGAAIKAKLTGDVSHYRRFRSEVIAVGGAACLRIESGAADPSRRAPRLALDLSGTLTSAGGGRLRLAPGSLPVIVRASKRCGVVAREPDRSETLALRQLLLPDPSRLAVLLHMPGSAVRRGLPFDVERSVVLEDARPAGGSGSTRVRRWALHLFFSPCKTAGC